MSLSKEAKLFLLSTAPLTLVTLLFILDSEGNIALLYGKLQDTILLSIFVFPIAIALFLVLPYYIIQVMLRFRQAFAPRRALWQLGAWWVLCIGGFTLFGYGYSVYEKQVIFSTANVQKLQEQLGPDVCFFAYQTQSALGRWNEGSGAMAADPEVAVAYETLVDGVCPKVEEPAYDTVFAYRKGRWLRMGI